MDRETWLKIRNTPRKDPRPLKFFHISRKIVTVPGPDGKPLRAAWSIGGYKRGMTQTDAQKGLEDTAAIPPQELAKYV
jgi:hypothetical protein